MRTLFLLLVALVPLYLQAQYGESIRTGRPGQAIGAFTVGKNVLQFQSGVTFDGSNYDQASVEDRNITGVAVIRFGLTEEFEVSTVWGYSRQRQNFENEQVTNSGLSNAQIGFRYNIRDGHGKGPNIGIQSRVKLNVLDDAFNQQNISNTTILAITQNLSPKIGLGTNIGINWSGNTGEPKGIYVINLGMPICSKSSVFIETYGSLENGDLDLHFDTGVDYVVNPDLKFDISFGYGNNNHIQGYFIDFGFSWRTLTKPRDQ